MSFSLGLKHKKWISLSAAIGFVAFLAYLGFFTDFTGVASVIAKIDIPIYALAFACVLGSAVFNALTWHHILGNLSVKTTFRRAFNLSWVGTFVDAIIPGGWSGDIFKAYLLSKDQEGEGAKITASIVIKNILELLVTLAALVVGIVLLTVNYTVSNGIILAVCVTMAFLALPLVIVVYLSMNFRVAKKLLALVEYLLTRVKGKYAAASNVEKMESSLSEFHEGMMTIKSNPMSLVRPIILQTFAWGFDILTLYLIFTSIGYIISPDKVIITNTIVANLQTQGVALAGFTQMASSTIYTILGIAPFISAASSLLAGFTTFWFKTVVAFISFHFIVLSRNIPFGKKWNMPRRDHKEGDLLLLKGAS